MFFEEKDLYYNYNQCKQKHKYGNAVNAMHVSHP
jgi:hypothetical protein